MPNIYIAYSRIDKAMIQPVIADLKSYLYDMVDFVMSDNLDNERITTSDLILCFITHASLSSKEVSEELKYASDLNKRIVGLKFCESFSVSEKIKYQVLKNRIRSTCYDWNKQEEKNSFVTQLIAHLGLESPICCPTGTRVSIDVISRDKFLVSVDGALREYISSRKIIAFFDEREHTLKISSVKYPHCSLEQTIVVSETKELLVDLDTRIEETGYEGEVNNEGNIYKGWIRNGMFNGHGIYRMKSGNIYEGDFQNGKLNFGSLRDISGNLYYGSFSEWKRNGQGKQVFSSGHKYEGQWLNDRFSGEGKLLAPSETEFIGRFENHRFVQGKIVYPDGSVYEGQSVSWKRHGKGKLTFKNGATIVGIWEADIQIE